ncbi:uncharacterized protein LOC110261323 [Sus scrofa]|uniref:uncharacterized protein LOC110261323 n=1 Tax=Sus scrofa TaxID=9823 RepID=UPI000A2B2617|nr:uncharacterized protein LOC110261323 [Sus scrofa]XP_020952994.1 uncharacterized protein LOC110261323 [Sus scrofa]
MEVPRRGVQSELQPRAYTTATATPDPIPGFELLPEPGHSAPPPPSKSVGGAGCYAVGDLHPISLQGPIPSPLSEARDRTRVLMDLSQTPLSQDGNSSGEVFEATPLPTESPSLDPEFEFLLCTQGPNSDFRVQPPGRKVPGALSRWKSRELRGRARAPRPGGRMLLGLPGQSQAGVPGRSPSAPLRSRDNFPTAGPHSLSAQRSGADPGRRPHVRAAIQGRRILNLSSSKPNPDLSRRRHTCHPRAGHVGSPFSGGWEFRGGDSAPFFKSAVPVVPLPARGGDRPSSPRPRASAWSPTAEPAPDPSGTVADPAPAPSRTTSVPAARADRCLDPRCCHGFQDSRSWRDGPSPAAGGAARTTSPTMPRTRPRGVAKDLQGRFRAGTRRCGRDFPLRWGRRPFAPGSSSDLSPVGARSQPRGDRSEEALEERLSPLHNGSSAEPRR